MEPFLEEFNSSHKNFGARKINKNKQTADPPRQKANYVQTKYKESVSRLKINRRQNYVLSPELLFKFEQRRRQSHTSVVTSQDNEKNSEIGYS